MKYYYIFLWAEYAGGTWRPIGEAIDKHPIDYFYDDVAKWASGGLIRDTVLGSWQEISESEYKKFQLD